MTSTTTTPPLTAANFEDLLVAHQPSIFGFIRSMVGGHSEAEDLLQITNLILWRKREGFEAGTNFRAWAFTIARLEVFTHLRQRRRDERIRALQPDPEPAGAPAFLPHSSRDPDALTALRECLKSLPDRDRELLTTRYGTNRTLEDYARTINRSPGTLKARLFKIRETLRRDIQQRLDLSY